MLKNTLILLLFLTFKLALFSSENTVCAFCDEKIIERQVVFKTPCWLVLLNYKTPVLGALLIVPIKHCLTRYDLSLEESIDLYNLQQKINLVLKKRFGETINDLQYEKNGIYLQSVNHFHIHILPLDKSYTSYLAQMMLTFRLFIFSHRVLSNDRQLEEQQIYQKLFQEREKN